MVFCAKFCMFFQVFLLTTFAPAVAQKRMIPHLSASEGGFASTLLIANTSGDVRTYQLLGFDKEGRQVAQAEGQINPFHTEISGITTLFQNEISHLEIARAEGMNISVAYQRVEPGTGPAQVTEINKQSKNWRIYLGNPQVTWDGMAAVNTSSELIDISVHYYGSDGELLAEPLLISDGAAAQSKSLFLFNDIPTSPAPAYVDIVATGDMALVALRGNLAFEYLWENQAIPLDNRDPIDSRLIVHVTAPNGGFSSQLILNNTSAEEAALEIRAFRADGTLIQSVQQVLLAKQTLFLDAAQALGEETSHVEIMGAPQVLTSMSYEREGEQTGSAQVHATHQTSRHWHMYPGDSGVTWDGIALVNQGSSAADVYMSQIDNQGRLLRGPIKMADQLAPMAKSLYVLADDFQPIPKTHFEINSEEELAVLAIRGNLGSDFLWENMAIILPEPAPSALPPARIDYAFAYHPEKQTAIMVGGFDENFALLEDTWIWNGRRWGQIETPQSPLPRSHHGGTFFPPTGDMIIFGGFRNRTQKGNDFMAFDGVTWKPFPGHQDIPTDDGELVFDTSGNKLVLTVSQGNDLQTWEYEQQWQPINTAVNPGKRLDQAFVFEAHTGRIILFGGLTVSNAFSDETWAYVDQTWQKLNPSQSPPALIGAATYYDSKRQRIVLFGGMNASRQVVSDMWVFKDNNWEKLTINDGPEARWVTYAVYNPVRDVATIFGGEGQQGQGLVMFRDTWEFDGEAWEKR